MTISLAQWAMSSIVYWTNIGSFMLKHDPVLVRFCIIILFTLKLEELYLVNSKKVLIVQFNSKTLKDTKVQN